MATTANNGGIISDLPEDAVYRARVNQFRSQVGDANAFLLHRITVADSNCIVIQSLMINGNAIGGTDCILASVPAADGIFIFIEATQVVLEFIYDSFSFLRKSVFFYERENSNLVWCQWCGYAQDHTFGAIFQFFFPIG